MDKEKQRIKIAEALGYTHVRIVKAIEGPPDIGIGHHPTEPHSVPDYLNDLNAMHHEIKNLNAEHLKIFTDHLKTIAIKVFKYTCTTDEVWCSCFKLNANHWAEAFLKTFNLWEE